MKSRYLCGLDLGSGQDFTALAIVEQTRRRQHRFSYSVRHLERFPAGTGFEEIAEQLMDLLSQSPLRGCELILDLTAVGIPVWKLIRGYRLPVHSLRAVTLGSGQASSQDESGVWVIPRKELVSTVQILLQSRRLKVARTLPQADLFTREMSEFKAGAHTECEGWREGRQDDLILSVAIALWSGERLTRITAGKPEAIIHPRTTLL